MTALIWKPAAIAALALALAIGAWAVLWHGPAQYEAGGLATAARLDAATHQAAKDLANEAERNRFLLSQCRVSGGVFDFATGECQR